MCRQLFWAFYQAHSVVLTKQRLSQFPNVHQNIHAGMMSHNYNVPSVYSVGQNIPASVSQTCSQSVQTPHHFPSMVWGKITLQVQLNLKVFFNLNCLRLPVIVCPVCLVWGKICVICSKFNMINVAPLALWLQVCRTHLHHRASMLARWLTQGKIYRLWYLGLSKRTWTVHFGVSLLTWICICHLFWQVIQCRSQTLNHILTIMG